MEELDRKNGNLKKNMSLVFRAECLPNTLGFQVLKKQNQTPKQSILNCFADILILVKMGISTCDTTSP